MQMRWRCATACSSSRLLHGSQGLREACSDESSTLSTNRAAITRQRGTGGEYFPNAEPEQALQPHARHEGQPVAVTGGRTRVVGVHNAVSVDALQPLLRPAQPRALVLAEPQAHVVAAALRAGRGKGCKKDVGRHRCKAGRGLLFMAGVTVRWGGQGGRLAPRLALPTPLPTASTQSVSGAQRLPSLSRPRAEP